MQVILREEVTHLGEIGDIVNVKPGYARNFLFPRGKAVRADARQVKCAQHERRLIEAAPTLGLVDGMSGRLEPTVDGMPIEVHVGIVELLSAAVRRGLAG